MTAHRHHRPNRSVEDGREIRLYCQRTEPAPCADRRFWNWGAREIVDIGAAAKGNGFGASSFHRAVCVHLRNNSLTWNEAPNQFPFATDTGH